MIIDDYIVVRIGDGEVCFHNPEFRAWAVFTGLEEDEKDKELTAEDKAKKFWNSNLAEVRNIKRRDETLVTVEDLKELKHPMTFYHQARKGFLAALNALLLGEGAEAKNESTAG